MTHPFKEYYAKANACNAENIPDFPVIVDVEVTNKCNFKCTMCAGQAKVDRKRGFMTTQVYYHLTEELKKHKTPIRLVRWGEPTLHPYFYSLVCGVSGLIPIHVNTNGLKLDGLRHADSVKFSFQGVDKHSYRKVRGDHYDKIVENITCFYNNRVDGKPFIEIGTTTEGEDATAFVEQMSAISDKVSVGRTYHVGGDNSDLEPLVNCTEVYSKLSVNWDGSVSMCCMDYDNFMIVGDLRKETLEEIWNGDKVKEVRDTLSRENKPCSGCYIYTGMEKGKQ